MFFIAIGIMKDNVHLYCTYLIDHLDEAEESLEGGFHLIRILELDAVTRNFALYYGSAWISIWSKEQLKEIPLRVLSSPSPSPQSPIPIGPKS